MTRWIVFDDETAAATRQRGGSVVLHPDGNIGGAISDALQQDAPLVAVVPAREQGMATVLRFERRVRTRPPMAEPGMSFAPTGFLGLSDTVVLEEEPPRPKKWWQKILD